MYRKFAILLLSIPMTLMILLNEVKDGNYKVTLNHPFSADSEMLARTVIEARMTLPPPTATPAPMTPQLRDQSLLADTSLISGKPCSAPCWHGITPGETSWRDAVLTLEDDSEVENLQLQEDTQSDAVGAVWAQNGGESCCQMVAEDGETISLIFLRLRPDMTLGEVFEVHGEPTYAIGISVTDDQAIINLVYPEVPMIVLAFAAGLEGQVSKDSEVVGVFYTTAEDMTLFLQTNFLHEWTGYGDFSEYTNAEGVEFDVTPSVTLTPTAASDRNAAVAASGQEQ